MKAPQVNLKKAIREAQASQMQFRQRLNALETVDLEPAYNPDSAHGTVSRINADLLTEGTYQESLTTYAVGYPVGTLEADVEFLAPAVQVARRFDYKAFSNPEAFFSDTDEDLRSIGADFKEVEYTKEEETAKTLNRGLMITLDADQVRDMPGWEQMYTGMLVRRLLLNKARRAIALLSAAATNANKTWDATAGKDPDNDVLTDIVTAHTAAGVRPNRVAYGPTAWSKRLLAHRAQDNAGGYASAGLTQEQLAQFLAIEGVLVCEARYSTSLTAKAEALSNLVLMYNALAGATTEDPSNVKGFFSPCDNGQRLMVHRWDVGAKKRCLAVEHYELLKITSTLGIRKQTVS